MNPETLFQQHFDHIGLVAESICRRNNVRDHDAEDFASDVRLKLHDDDYAVIRKFRGSSSFTTYLRVVIANLFRDYQIKRWGKWRPSAPARRLGETAVALETLIYRDGHTFDSACHVLEQKKVRAVERSELRRLLTQLPRRLQRRPAHSEALETVPAAEETDTVVLDSERDDRMAAAELVLRRALDQLDHEEQLILKMLYFHGIPVADIARKLGVEQKPLYPRIRRLLKELHQQLEAEGFHSDLLDYLHDL